MSTAIWVALPTKSSIKEGRRLVLVDIENLAGGAELTPAMVTACYRDLAAVGLLTKSDQVVLAASHHAMEVAAFAWSGSTRREMRSGPDGADLALLDVLSEHVEDRFDAVVIASGDGIFTQQVAALTAAGTTVTVASRPESLAARLRLAATSVVLLSPSQPVNEKVSA